MKQKTIAIIGMGQVGSTVAHTLLLSIPGITLILVDSNQDKCKGEQQDLDDAISEHQSSQVLSGTLKDAGKADIIIITAGIAQKPGQTRLELLDTNKTIIQSIIEEMKPIKSSAILIMVTNPVDILSLHAYKISQLPNNQVFGSGTLLDTIRLKEILSPLLSVTPESLDINVLGEHGDSQFIAWSSATVNGVPLETFKQFTELERHNIEQQVRNKAYEIIIKKGSTSFGVASCVELYCHAIIYDKKTITPVSCYQEKSDIYLSVPVIIGALGIEKQIPLILNQEEQQHINSCIQKLKDLD